MIAFFFSPFREQYFSKRSHNTPNFTSFFPLWRSGQLSPLHSIRKHYKATSYFAFCSQPPHSVSRELKLICWTLSVIGQYEVVNHLILVTSYDLVF